MDYLTNKNINLVAHRGYAKAFPENSLSAFQAAVDCGCMFLELDVQLSSDLVPIVIHDDNLLRTGSKDISILKNKFSLISENSVGEAERFGEKFKNEIILSLSDFAQWLSQYPEVKVFVELKEESIELFGHKNVLDKTLEAIASIKDQCFLISFDAPFLFHAKQYSDYPIGFVLHEYKNDTRKVAEQLQPELLICNYKKIPDTDDGLWMDSWEWFLYEICDPELAKKWLGRGVSYIETMDIKPMLQAFSNEL